MGLQSPRLPPQRTGKGALRRKGGPAAACRPAQRTPGLGGRHGERGRWTRAASPRVPNTHGARSWEAGPADPAIRKKGEPRPPSAAWTAPAEGAEGRTCPPPTWAPGPQPLAGRPRGGRWGPEPGASQPSSAALPGVAGDPGTLDRAQLLGADRVGHSLGGSRNTGIPPALLAELKAPEAVGSAKRSSRARASKQLMKIIVLAHNPAHRGACTRSHTHTLTQLASSSCPTLVFRACGFQQLA